MKTGKYLSLALLIWLISLSLFTQVDAQGEDPNCPGAPVPMLVVGAQGRVVPGDANNVRDAAAKSGNKTGAIPGGEIFDVLEGPVCADGLNWWHVDYQGLNGWTVEGQGTEYWVVPYDPEAPTSTPLPPTETPSPTATFAPAVLFEAPRPVDNVLDADTIPGVEARVISDDPVSEEVRLLVHSAPGRDAEILGSVPSGATVIIESAPTEADGFFWRKIGSDNGTKAGLEGWVVEGFIDEKTGAYERTLLPQCPATQTPDRIAFFIARYLYVADPDGSAACILDKLRLPAVHTFYSYFAYFPNELVWSPDHMQIMYIDSVDQVSGGSLQELFIVDANGLGRRQVTHGSDVYWADWSPDGNRILLSQSINGRGEPQIWTMKVDGSAYGALTSGDHRKVWGGWLADSETVVYVENIGEARNQIGPTEQEFIFYTVNVTSGGLKEVYRTKEDLTDAQLSPDRSKVLITSWGMTPIEGSKYFEYTDLNVRILDVATGEVTVFPDADYGSVWLPDSSGVVSLIDGENLTRVLIGDDEAITVSLSEPLSDIKWIRGWLPDGRLLVLMSDYDVYSPDGYQLFAVDIHDGTVTTLIDAVDG